MAERIGDFLVRTGRLGPGDVDKVIAAQSASGGTRLFGELAVELGFISAAEFRKAMDEKGSA